jgi:hypothetical protein
LLHDLAAEGFLEAGVHPGAQAPFGEAGGRKSREPDDGHPPLRMMPAFLETDHPRYHELREVAQAAVHHDQVVRALSDRLHGVPSVGDGVGPVAGLDQDVLGETTIDVTLLHDQDAGHGLQQVRRRGSLPKHEPNLSEKV